MGPVIGVPGDGPFQCCDALACWLLLQVPQFQNLEVVRTADPAQLEDFYVLLGVGGEYDPSRHRFDHRTLGFKARFSERFHTRLSCAGLVYKHYGREVLAALLEWQQDHPDLDTVHHQVYRTFLEAVDAEEHRIAPYSAKVLRSGAAAPRYQDNTTLCARVRALNPRWNQPCEEETHLLQFQAAMQLVGGEFRAAAERVAAEWLPARRPVRQALRARRGVDPSGKILLLREGCPWSAHLHDLEREEGCVGQVLFVVFQDERDGSFRVQAVSKGSAFSYRRLLPVSWRGLKEEELSLVTGIPGCKFVHASGYIGGNSTLQGALRMAKYSLSFR